MAKKWVTLSFAIIAVFMIVMCLLVDLRLKASILEIARTQAELMTVEAINEAVNNNIVAKTDYQDLVYIHKDVNDRVVMIQANTVKINQLMAATVNEVIASTKSLQANAINLHLGEITGSVLLTGRGPAFNVRVLPIERVNVEVENKFDQAGVNQTRHIIAFKINTAIKIAVPLVSEELEVSTTVPIADTVIVGDVPQTYVNFSGNIESVPLGLNKY